MPMRQPELYKLRLKKKIKKHLLKTLVVGPRKQNTCLSKNRSVHFFCSLRNFIVSTKLCNKLDTHHKTMMASSLLILANCDGLKCNRSTTIRKGHFQDEIKHIKAS